MSYTVAPGLGVVVGLTTGLVCERLPVPPVLQTTGAGVLSLLLGSLAAAILWLLRPPPNADISAISFGLAEGALVTGASAVLCALLHYGLGQVATGVGWPFLATHRATVVGVGAGLYGSVSFLLETGLLRPMGR